MKTQAQPVFNEIARRLADRLDDLLRKPTRALITGTEAPISHIIQQQYQHIAILSSTDTSLQTEPANLLIGHLPLSADVAQVLAQATPLLAPDSPVILTLLGLGSFAETQSPPPLPDVRDIGDLPGIRKLSLPVIDRDRLTLTFENEAALHRTFEAHGWPLAALSNMNINKLTIEIIYIHGHTKGPNQPQPAKRGSGKVSMVKILHTNSES
ncbi:MAG TPA: hypothetical protein VHP58_04590 [Alphaproteobacteria bacterium]|nr:hypothetical protein [Alphaproteobacteria bacterium]